VPRRCEAEASRGLSPPSVWLRLFALCNCGFAGRQCIRELSTAPSEISSRYGHTVYVGEMGGQFGEDPRKGSADLLRQLANRVDALAAEVEQLQRRLRAMENQAMPPALPPTSAMRFGPAAVNRVGALTLAIGIVFFFKYAVDSQWIGPRMRVMLGLAAGIALIAVAEALRRRGQSVFSQGIAGCGVATLYIACYAAFAWYQWFSYYTAAAALVAVSATAVVLSMRHANGAVAVLGFTGAVLTPILLRSNETAALVPLLYLLLIDVTAVWISTRRRWRLPALCVAGEIAVAGFIFIPSEHPDWFLVFTLAVAAERFAAAAATIRGNVRDSINLAGHCFVVLGVLREIVLWTDRAIAEPVRAAAKSELGSVFLALYGIAALAIGIARRSRPALGFGLALTGAVILKLYLWDVWFLQRLYRMSAFGMLGILLLAASWIYSHAKDPS
jgi:uncharacterized membrane protein